MMQTVNDEDEELEQSYNLMDVSLLLCMGIFEIESSNKIQVVFPQALTYY